MAGFSGNTFIRDLTMPCSWGTCMDVGGKFAGTFSGSMNMMGNLGGAASPVVVAWIVQQWSYSVAFNVSVWAPSLSAEVVIGPAPPVAAPVPTTVPSVS